MWQALNAYYPGPMLDFTHLESILRGVSANSPPYRSSGTRARRNWKKRRAAGRAK